jgi:hypothetical protein
MAKAIENINKEGYVFSNEEIQSLLQTQRDFIEGKTTARDWTEIKEELDDRFFQPLT